jgi:hypothetical protein
MFTSFARGTVIAAGKTVPGVAVDLPGFSLSGASGGLLEQMTRRADGVGSG